LLEAFKVFLREEKLESKYGITRNDLKEVVKKAIPEAISGSESSESMWQTLLQSQLGITPANNIDQVNSAAEETAEEIVYSAYDDPRYAQLADVYEEAHEVSFLSAMLSVYRSLPTSPPTPSSSESQLYMSKLAIMCEVLVNSLPESLNEEGKGKEEYGYLRAWVNRHKETIKEMIRLIKPSYNDIKQVLQENGREFSDEFPEKLEAHLDPK
jgi:hypothetical protein